MRVEDKLNLQNICIYAASLEDICVNIRTFQRFHNSGKVMVWADIPKIDEIHKFSMFDSKPGSK